MPRKSRVTDGHAGVQVEIMIPVRHNGRVKDMGKVPPKPQPPRVPRVARLMALAIKFQNMVDRGEVRDYADLARLGYVTRARMTQIMNLMLLAPDIQEALLDMTENNAFTEHEARSATKHVEWAAQRRVLASLRDSGQGDGTLGENA